MAFADAGNYELHALGAEFPEIGLRGVLAQLQDRYWSENYWKESYFRADYDFEDYAPAYCVGYRGCAQYGGRFEDARTSLCANFIRIKGDSRLTWEEAIGPIRAGWERMAAVEVRNAEPSALRIVNRMALGPALA